MTTVKNENDVLFLLLLQSCDFDYFNAKNSISAYKLVGFAFIGFLKKNNILTPKR